MTRCSAAAGGGLLRAPCPPGPARPAGIHHIVGQGAFFEQVLELVTVDCVGDGLV